MDKKTELIRLTSWHTLETMDEYLNMINISFLLSEAKGSVGSGNTSSSSPPLLHCSRHSHTIPKASSRGRGLKKATSNRALNIFSFHKLFQSLITLSLYLSRIPILHLVTAASCPCLCLSEESLALPALHSSQEGEVLQHLLVHIVPSPPWESLAALPAAWHDPCGTGEPRLEHRTAGHPSERGKGLFLPAWGLHCCHYSPLCCWAIFTAKANC